MSFARSVPLLLPSSPHLSHEAGERLVHESPDRRVPFPHFTCLSCSWGSNDPKPRAALARGTMQKGTGRLRLLHVTETRPGVLT